MAESETSEQATRSPSPGDDEPYPSRWTRVRRSFFTRHVAPLSLFVIALALIPLYGAVSLLLHEAKFDPSKLRAHAPPAPPVLAKACVKHPAWNGIVIVTSLNNFDLQDGTESLDIGLCIGSDLSQGLRNDKCKPVLTFSIPGAETPRPQSVRVSDRAPVRGAGRPNAYQPIGATTVDVAGDPRLYPLDSYAGLLQWSMTLHNAGATSSSTESASSKGAAEQPATSKAPSSRDATKNERAAHSARPTNLAAPTCTVMLATTSGGKPTTSSGEPTPAGGKASNTFDGLKTGTFTSATYVAGGASALTWKYQERSISPFPDLRAHRMTFAGNVQFGGERPFNTIQLFVAALVAVLAILVAGLIVRMFDPNPLTVETVAIVGALLIAVLPVRLVLVPTAIGSLVLVDYALAFLMAALVAGLIVAQLVGRQKKKRDRRAGRPEPAPE
jgi:hypothetical protein